MIEEGATETSEDGMTATVMAAGLEETEAEIGATTTGATGEEMEVAILTAAAMIEEEAMTDEATAMIDGETITSANPNPRCPKKTSRVLLKQLPRPSIHKHTLASL